VVKKKIRKALNNEGVRTCKISMWLKDRNSKSLGGILRACVSAFIDLKSILNIFAQQLIEFMYKIYGYVLFNIY